jgi:hypothetical protein
MKDSTKGVYLATDAIAGAATEFQFGSLFTRGGHLLAIASWTRDGGSGSDDYLVAISSRGQLAVYAGTDPASADTWALVGVFDVPQPIGRRCWRRYGGDVLLLTVEGLFPLSSLLSVDESQAKRVAVSECVQLSGAILWVAVRLGVRGLSARNPADRQCADVGERDRQAIRNEHTHQGVVRVRRSRCELLGGVRGQSLFRRQRRRRLPG